MDNPVSLGWGCVVTQVKREPLTAWTGMLASLVLFGPQLPAQQQYA